MPEPTLVLPFVTIPIYSLALVLGILVSVGIGIRRSGARTGVVVDCCLGAMIGAVGGARLEHVLLNWAYFASNSSEALRPSAGGLGWHGAVIGGLLGLALVARWRKLALRPLLDALSPALPVLAFAGWLGCWAAVCAYGVEIPTLAGVSPLAAAESRDVYGIVAPRINTQAFGMALAVLLLILSVMVNRRGWLTGRRFWLLLALLSGGMFALGFLRGDVVPVAAGLRADQWLDVGFFLWSTVLTLYNSRQGSGKR